MPACCKYDVHSVQVHGRPPSHQTPVKISPSDQRLTLSASSKKRAWKVGTIFVDLGRHFFQQEFTNIQEQYSASTLSAVFSKPFLDDALVPQLRNPCSSKESSIQTTIAEVDVMDLLQGIKTGDDLVVVLKHKERVIN